MTLEWGETPLSLNFTASIIKGALYGITDFLYWLYLQSFLIVSDPAIAKHILKDNAKGYSKVRKSTVIGAVNSFSAPALLPYFCYF
jgi:hypothetical protein